MSPYSSSLIVHSIALHLQEPILYVSDPKALHNILIKEEAIFQETPEFIQYVQLPSRICLRSAENFM